MAEHEKTKEQLNEELKRLEAKIEEFQKTNRYMYMMFENLPEAFFICNSDGMLLEANKAFRNLIGYEKGEIIGENILKKKFMSAKQIAKLTEMLFKIAINQISSPEKLVISKKDGSELKIEVSTFPIKLQGQDSVMFVVHDTERQRKAEAELRYRIRLEKTVSDISTRFVNVMPDETDSEINRALMEVGLAAGVDRSYLFLYDELSKKVSNTHEWCNKNIESHIKRLQDIPVESFPWLFGKLSKNEVFYIHRVSEMPSEASAEKGEFTLEGIKSIINVPLFYGEKIAGFLGFDSVRQEKEWHEDTAILLKILGEVFISAIERKKTRNIIWETEELFKTILKTSPDAIVATNMKGDITVASKKMVELHVQPYFPHFINKSLL